MGSSKEPSETASGDTMSTETAVASAVPTVMTEQSSGLELKTRVSDEIWFEICQSFLQVQDEKHSDASPLDDSSSICLDVEIIPSEMGDEPRLPDPPMEGRSLGHRDSASAFDGIKHSENIPHEGVK